MVCFVTCRLGAFLSCLIVFAATGRDRDVKVCPGTGLSIQDLAEYSRKNCTVIEGPLVLYGIPSSDSDETNNETVTGVPITPLNTIVEITGTLGVFRLDKSVDNLGQILPNLAVIRGHPHLRYPGVNVSVAIAENEHLKSINLTKLTHILGDDEDTASVIFYKNERLQYIDTVKWDWISSEGLEAVFLGNSKEDVGCRKDCNGYCWSKNFCQTLFNCSAVDLDGKCNCHEECLSSCHGIQANNCVSCKNFHHEGRCVPTCPNGTFIVAGWRCVNRCPYVESSIVQNGNRIPQPLFAFKGECVLNCPGNYTEDNDTKTCIPCSNASSCEKRCAGGTVRSLHDAERFEGCVHIEGSLEINILTDSNDRGDLSRYLGSIRHVDGYVVVINSPRLETLEFLDNLTSIGARDLVQFGEQLYGLAIVSNRNLRSVSWKEQQNLWLGGRRDVRVLFLSNYLACEDDIMDLQLQFPSVVDSKDNGILAVCNFSHLSLTTRENDTGTTYLQWDPVPQENQIDLIAYQIFWQNVGVVKSIPDPFLEEYDDNNPESCGNTGWRSVTVGNVTSYMLDRHMLRPWNTAVFQVRAEFSRRGIGFKSDMLLVNGSLAVPSCPIIEGFKDDKGFNVTVVWWPPKYYSQNVTHYRIAVTLLDQPISMTSISPPLGNRTSDNTSCSVDTAASQSRHPCINYTVLVTDYNSCDGWCWRTISGLRNYFKYQVEIQATSPAGCGLASREVYDTEPDYELDKVSDMNLTSSPGPSPSTENVQVSWKRPEYPNGGYVQYYEVSIQFQVSKQEERDFHHSHDQWVLPRMKELGCNYTSGTQQSYFCQIRSNGTWSSLNLTLMRVPDRELSYDVIVRVASVLGKPSEAVPEIRKQLTVAADPSGTSPNQSSDSRVVVIVVVLVLVCLVLVIVVLVYAVWRQKRKLKHQLRDRIEATSRLYICLDGGTLVSREYVPDEWEIQRDEVVLSRELGRGAFGSVYQGTWQNPDGQRPLDVAVKTLSDESSSEDRLSFLYEASVMKHFSSDHIVRLLGIVSQGTPVMVVMELMRKGDLKEYLRSLRPEDEGAVCYEKFPVSDEEILQLAVQIASGMVYLTNKKFVHRDLAARNCMVTEDVRVKIGDFGLARDVYQSDYYRKRGRGVLPVRWMPPESLQDGVFTHSSDIWSFGIVLWEIATLAMQPYPGKNNSEVFEYVVRGGVMDVSEMKHVPTALLTIMGSCWLYKPLDRPTFESILACLPPLDGVEIEV